MTNKQKTNSYKSVICTVLALVLTMALALPALASDAVCGVVRNPNGGSYVNLRDYPAYFGKVLTRIQLGTKVDIVGREGDWYAVRLGCLSGYMHSWFINTSAKEPQQGNAWVRTYNGGRLNLRTYASVCADVLGLYKSGTAVTVIDYTPTWCKVLVEGKTGYMKTEYLTFDKSAAFQVPECGKKPASILINTGVFEQAEEQPLEWTPNRPEMPKWQLSWGTSPVFPNGCFR